MNQQRSAIVSIIGRPNVGKSSIFNRLMRKAFLSMSYDIPGVTRDRHYGVLKLDDLGEQEKTDLILVDTGGFYPEKIKIEIKKNNIDPFFNLMGDHAELAIKESDLILLVVDVREGLNPFDEMIVQKIRSNKKPFWLLVNKFDSEKQTGDEVDFYQLGISEDEMFLISAEHARGLNDLRECLQRFVSKLPALNDNSLDDLTRKGITPKHEVVASVAIIGAPNAGKSTLLNSLVGSARALVSDIAGTTVDPIEGYIDLNFGEEAAHLISQENRFIKSSEELLDEWKSFSPDASVEDFDFDVENEKILIDFDDLDGKKIESEEAAFDFDDIDLSLPEQDLVMDSEENEISEPLSVDSGWRSIKVIDTAGIRKMKLVSGFIEEQSVYRSLKSITEADVVLCMIDVTKGFTHQDRRLCDIALEKGKSLIVLFNKIDQAREIFQDHKKRTAWLKDLKLTTPWLAFCDMLTISAMKGAYLNQLKKSLVKTIYVRHQKISTAQLNKSVTKLVDAHPVVLKRSNGNRFKVKYASMIKVNPPTVLLFANKSMGIPDNYRRYLVSGLRKDFNLVNTPIHLIFRTSSDLERRMKKMESKTQTKKFTK